MPEFPWIGSLATRRCVIAAAAAGWLVGCAAEASAGAPVEMSIVDRESGQVLKTYRQGGRLFVAGRPGSRYSLRVHNATAERVMVVMSVDGVNIITGQTADCTKKLPLIWDQLQSDIEENRVAPLARCFRKRQCDEISETTCGHCILVREKAIICSQRYRGLRRRRLGEKNCAQSARKNRRNRLRKENPRVSTCTRA